MHCLSKKKDYYLCFRRLKIENWNKAKFMVYLTFDRLLSLARDFIINFGDDRFLSSKLMMGDRVVSILSLGSVTGFLSKLGRYEPVGNDLTCATGADTRRFISRPSIGALETMEPIELDAMQ